MTRSLRIPPRLVIGLAAAILIDTAVQLSWKVAATTLPDTMTAAAIVSAVLHKPVFIALLALLICQLVNWLKVLDHADLSYAQPITALSYVSVCLLSAIWLGESIHTLHVVGIGFIFAGVWLISQTDHRSSPTRTDP